MKVSYDNEPKALRVLGDGRCIYCFNIEQKHDEENPDMNVWECEQVEVFEPITQDRILSAVISDKWDNNYEQKLFNECMSAQMGIYTDGDAKIAKYQSFLRERKAIKEMVDADCNKLGIK